MGLSIDKHQHKTFWPSVILHSVFERETVRQSHEYVSAVLKSEVISRGELPVMEKLQSRNRKVIFTRKCALNTSSLL